MHNIISQATGGSLASGYTGVTETTSINHGKMTAQVYTSPVWTPPPQPVQFQPLYMPLDPYLGQPFPKIQQYSPPPQFYSHSTQIHSPPQVHQQPPQIHSPPLYQPTYFPPIIPTESSQHLSFYPASPMNSPLTRQQRKTQFISTTSSGKQLAATRLEPMATKTQQTYATYYSHRIFVGSLARMTTPGDLAKYFSRFGLVIEAKVVLDSAGLSKGYGFVSFDSSDVVKRVLSAGALYMNNKRIAVASAIRKKHFDED